MKAIATLRSLACAFALMGSPFGHSEEAEVSLHEGLQVSRVGSGLDLVFIPGLLSAAEVFRETCAGLTEVRCHLLQLPGFAGLAPLSELEQGFLEPVAERIASYIDQHTDGAPVIVGHSLGGWLALKLATQEPALTRGLVLIDALPYFPVAQNPRATPEQMRPLAESMLERMASISDEQFERGLPMQLLGMTRSEERTGTLRTWALASDRPTMAQAMFDMQVLDLRPDLPGIDTPAIILGAWAAYAGYGFTQETARTVFDTQYQGLPEKEIHLSEAGYHFLMWDDQAWLLAHIEAFLDEVNGHD